MQFVIRFIVGGLIVSFFAAFGDTLKPKSFAGLFGAAPSVALATLAISLVREGPLYASIEARSMIAGAVGVIAYTWLTLQLTARGAWGAKSASTLSLAAWFLCSIGIWALALR